MMEITLVRDDLEEVEEKQIKVEQGTTVTDLLNSEGIEPQEVLVSRNGTIISGKHQLQENDSIKVLDVIAGG